MKPLFYLTFRRHYIKTLTEKEDQYLLKYNIYSIFQYDYRNLPVHAQLIYKLLFNICLYGNLPHAHRSYWQDCALAPGTLK